MTGRRAGIGLRKQPVESAIDNIDRALEAIGTELETLERRVTALKSAWNGEAKEAFAVAMAECSADLAALHGIGSSLSKVARSSVTRIDDFDRRRAGAWGG